MMPVFDQDWTPAEREAVHAVRARVNADLQGAEDIVVDRDTFELVESAFGKVWMLDPETDEWFVANILYTPRDRFGLYVKGRVVTYGD